MRILQLVEERLVVVFEVVVYDDIGLGVAFCHLDGASAEDGDAADALLRQHVVEDRRANEARRAGEDEMHLGAKVSLRADCLGVVEQQVERDCLPPIYSGSQARRATSTISTIGIGQAVPSGLSPSRSGTMAMSVFARTRCGAAPATGDSDMSGRERERMVLRGTQAAPTPAIVRSASRAARPAPGRMTKRTAARGKSPRACSPPGPDLQLAQPPVPRPWKRHRRVCYRMTAFALKIPLRSQRPLSMTGSDAFAGPWRSAAGRL